MSCGVDRLLVEAMKQGIVKTGIKLKNRRNHKVIRIVQYGYPVILLMRSNMGGREL